MTLDTHSLAPPASALAWREARALADLATLPFRLAGTALRRPHALGNGRRVIVLPGFGGGDRAMAPMRTYLRLHGFQAEGWGLGRNLAGLDRPHDPAEISWGLDLNRPYRGEGGVPHLCDLMTARVRKRAEVYGAPIALVGWSLGGTIAREVARDLPGRVDQVVTLGAPVIGGPKYTRAAKVFRRRGMDLDWIEAEVARRNARPIRCPVTAIVSPTDGIVGFHSTRDPHHADARYIEADVSHTGMGINGRTLRLVVEALTEQ
ncbi:alpha/beta fold hydrolase [Algiphilus sp. NNCM1]|uniref:esterase/lipase family protein n=1 Tax=Algiphilus sp. TaxID=1872431 RepID=UPI001CA627BE|nr:alpha/beta fold hydrolase [Algiphilus sp.]MBY8964746.1 alpha/beta fold hydrolase [Algiphilus acroporae]MCI5062539.1 alpha/beta fold hydrolase [Algiphilus sp.]MCI5104765.1 alpha/beta fold hydrolase [Algiphilus sp.]